MTAWQLVAQKGAQGSFHWAGLWNEFVDYSRDSVVTWDIEGYSISWISRNESSVGERPDLHPESWDIMSKAAKAEIVLSEGSVPDGGGTQTSAVSPAMIDIPGLTTAPAYSGPMTARIQAHPIGLGASGSTTAYFFQTQVVDDLGNIFLGGLTKFFLSSTTGLFVNANCDIKIPAASPIRTYRAQACMFGATGGIITWGGVLWAGSYNKTRLEMVPR